MHMRNLLIERNQENWNFAHTASVFLPFRRRRLNTFLPVLLAILALNPCFFFPFRVVGVFKFLCMTLNFTISIFHVKHNQKIQPKLSAICVYLGLNSLVRFQDHNRQMPATNTGIHLPNNALFGHLRSLLIVPHCFINVNLHLYRLK